MFSPRKNCWRRDGLAGPTIPPPINPAKLVAARSEAHTHIGRIRPTSLAGAFCVLANVGTEINQNLCMAFRESARHRLAVVQAQP